MIIALCVLLGIVIVTAKSLLKKVDRLEGESSKKEDIKGNFTGFVIFYTLLLILFFALITREQPEKIDNKEQLIEDTVWHQ